MEKSKDGYFVNAAYHHLALSNYSLEQRGFLFSMLNLLWLHDGIFPSDPRKIARALGIDTRLAKRLLNDSSGLVKHELTDVAGLLGSNFIRQQLKEITERAYSKTLDEAHLRKYKGKKILPSRPLILSNTLDSNTLDSNTIDSTTIDSITIDSTDNKAPQFKPPNVGEVRKFCVKYDIAIDADDFCNYYEVRGWRINGSQMVKWKPQVHIWANRERRRNPSRDEFSGQGVV